MEIYRFEPAVLEEVSVRIFEAVGASPETSKVVSSSLIEANLMGHDSHGVIRIPEYVNRVKAGRVRPDAQPHVQAEHKATALVSGEWAFGQVAGTFAMNEACRRAGDYGVGAVALVRCSHLGRVGAYVEQAAEANCAAQVWVGGLGDRPAVPHGGMRAALGTNPVSAGFPVEDEPPIVLDFATTVVAEGKVRVARDAGAKLPPGYLIDRQGRPTTDPEKLADDGGLLPFGGHKGYAMSVIAELFGQALTGADLPGGPPEEVFRRSGALFVAVSIGAFRPAASAKRNAKNLVTKLRKVPPADGVERVMTPGEPERAIQRRRAVAGIELPKRTWQAIVAAGESLGLSRRDFPNPLST